MIWPGCGAKVAGSIHMSWARRGTERRASRTAPAMGGRSEVRKDILGNRDIRNRRVVYAAVSLQQALMGGREERETVEVVLVVGLNSLGESSVGVARDDQADQHAVDVHLIAIRRR